MAEVKQQFTRLVNFRMPMDMFIAMHEKCAFYQMDLTSLLLVAVNNYLTGNSQKPSSPQNDEFSIDEKDREFLRVIAKRMTKKQGFEVTPSIVLKNYIERVEMEGGALPISCKESDVLEIYGKSYRSVLNDLKINKIYLKY